jgi:hypothetical protein
MTATVVTKKEYIDAINKAMKRTNDVPLLDLIYQILLKSEEVKK